MPERFTRTFAERLDRLGGVRVREASGRHRLEAGGAYVCPGGRCMQVVRDGSGWAAEVVPPGSADRYVPSVDRLFTSAAPAVGNKLIAVVLTGMGDDGARGVVAVKEAGGLVLAEAADTAVIYGMPGAAARTGAVDRSLPLRPLCDRLAELVS
jgi:two-component system chemotaxis response regulator CheB